MLVLRQSVRNLRELGISLDAAFRRASDRLATSSALEALVTCSNWHSSKLMLFEKFDGTIAGIFVGLTWSMSGLFPACAGCFQLII